MSALISVVTVVRNDAPGLERTAAAVRGQSATTIDWIIVDGASTDVTTAVARRLEADGAARVISESDKGLYDAMNKGAQAARGAFVLFLNAGDELVGPSTLEELEGEIRRVSPAARERTILYGRFYLRFGRMLRAGRVSDAEYIRHGLPTSHQAMLFPTEWLRANPFDLSYKVCGDYWLSARAYVAKLDFVRLPTSIAIYEAGGRSFQSPVRGWRESARVQQTVLRAGRLAVGWSLAVKVVRYGAFALLYWGNVSPLRRPLAALRGAVDTP